MSKLEAESLHQRKPSKRQAGNEDMLRNGPRESAKATYTEDEKAEMGTGRLVFQEMDDLKQAKGPELQREAQAESLGNMNPKDKRAVILLVILCLSFYAPGGRSSDLVAFIDLLQGIPVGLAFGSIPYLLRARLSYSQIGLFSLASYPYSLKLLWSPIVDSCYNPNWGRRKSWIVPVQLVVGCLLWWLGNNAQQLIEQVG